MSEARAKLAAMGGSGSRPYFHLLGETELDDLHAMLSALRDRRDEVLAAWYQAYSLYVGDQRSLIEAEFMRLFGLEFDLIVADILRRDMDAFAADVRLSGERLARYGVPFPEVIISLHLFEESAWPFFAGAETPAPRLYHSFDKLSHCRIVVLAEAYFHSTATRAAVRIAGLEREAARLGVRARNRFHGLVGASSAMRDLYERIEAAGATRGTVLIAGESGTGKELVARALHEVGPAPHAPFVALNCAAIPRELIESELFGYRRGAFSGATNDYLGLFRAAEGGSLFLDEVTEMGPDTQSKLLRTIQERTVRPVGSTREVTVNVRLIASTNRDLDAAVRRGHLREDLYYRLQASILQIAPLRERPEDIELLTDHFIEVFNRQNIRPYPVVGVEPDALEAMRAYRWPGNVRELANAIESAFTFGRSHTIRLEDLPATIVSRSGDSAPVQGLSLTTFSEAERTLVARALEAAAGNKVRAARMLGISRKRLYAKIAKFGL